MEKITLVILAAGMGSRFGGDIPGDEKWTQRISGMRIYKDTQLKAALEEAGFRDVQIYKHKRDWLCVLTRK